MNCFGFRKDEWTEVYLALIQNKEQSMTNRSNFVLAITIALVLAATSMVLGQTASNAALKNPAALKEMAPATYNVNFDTSAGAFVVEVHRDWAPNGADRFYNLVKNGYYDNIRFFRVIPGFMVQFGISGDPALNSVWQPARIPRDPVKQSNTRGFLTYAMQGGPQGPDTRTTQVFINFGNNAALDAQGFAPFGRVTKGMEVVDKIYSGYGEGAPSGKGPEQGRVQAEGNAYLTKDFPKLDYIKKATIEK
jgi:cyclophilin family peptidyl-prolyl cis-trans isomerase